MKFLFDEDEGGSEIDENAKKEDRAESIRMGIRRIKHNLDIINKELEELERLALNDKDLIEVRERNYDEYVKKAINKKRYRPVEKDETTLENDDLISSYRPNDFAKKLREYDE